MKLFLGKNMKIKKLTLPCLSILLLGATGLAQATILFTEDFESGLSQWTTGNAQIVSDPAGGSNKVLSFSQLNSAGDIFSSSALYSSNSSTFNLTFDYFGDNNNSGGFIGYSKSTPGTHIWLAGSDTDYSGTTLWQENILKPVTDRILIGDNSWQTYSFTFTSEFFNPIRLMLEDFVGSDQIAGNAYFDNIVLTDGTSSVPEPSVLALLSIGLIAVGFMRKKAG